MRTDLIFAAATWFVGSKELEEKIINPKPGQRGMITNHRNHAKRVLNNIQGLSTKERDEILKTFEYIWQKSQESARNSPRRAMTRPARHDDEVNG